MTFFFEKNKYVTKFHFCNVQEKFHVKKVDPYNGNEELDKGKKNLMKKDTNYMYLCKSIFNCIIKMECTCSNLDVIHWMKYNHEIV